MGAALNIATALEGRNITVTMAYADRLERFTRWWVQLWAESVGKDGKGSQPVAAIGPVDQHSQMQLYLGGPNDKLFTVLTTGVGGTWARDGRKAFEARGRTWFCAASASAILWRHRGARPPTRWDATDALTRTIHVDKLDERSLGELLMHYMLETILTGYALGVDPFDQPAVEEGKVLAKQYLGEAK